MAHVQEEDAGVVLVDGCLEEILVKLVLLREMQPGDHGVWPEMPGASLHGHVRPGALLGHQTALRILLPEGHHEAAAPLIDRFDLDRVPFEILAHARRALLGMHECVVRRVQRVFHRALVVVVDVEHGVLVRAPVLGPVLGNVPDRRALVLGQIAEKRKDEPVFLLHRIAVDLGARGRLLVVTE